MSLRFATLALALLTVPASALAETGASERSYSTSWTEGDATHRAVMFPHEIGGCKVMIQYKQFEKDRSPTAIEAEGRDCNCDLLIDGQEENFSAARGYAANKLLQVCQSKGIDGNERHLQIMRESLKVHPNFSRIPAVKAPEAP